MTTPRDIAMLRLVAQRIAGPGFASVANAVGWLTAVQGQDYRGAVTSIALRTAARTRQGVEAAMNAGEIVRSWPMRGTLHFVLAQDLVWMLDLTAPRMLAGEARRRAGLGLEAATIERAEKLATDALAGNRQLRRQELIAVWRSAGVVTEGQHGYHLIAHLAKRATLCFGPVVDEEQRLVLVSEWVPAPRRLERDQALGEWVLRYFRSHGPATVKDFTRWTSLVAADVKTGLALARPHLEPLEVDGIDYLMDPETPALLDQWRTAAGSVFLLPGFDEYVLGYQDRSPALPPEFATRVVPGGNGMFAPTVVVAGQIVGTWKRSPRSRQQPMLATPFTSFPPAVADALPQLYNALP